MTLDGTNQEIIAFINHLTDTSDTILLGRKMTDGFIKYRECVVSQPTSAEYAFASLAPEKMHPLALVAGALFLCGVALVASFVLSQCALRVDPMLVLRNE